MTKQYKPNKLTPVEALVVVLTCLFLLAIVSLACQSSRNDAFRIECAKNLSEIGKAMLIYANDYEDQLPRAGGRNTVWGRYVMWDAVDRFAAYVLSADGSGGKATISSSLYFLVKYAEVAPKYFVCPGDSGTTVFKLSDYPNRNLIIDEYIHAWDFGPEAWKHCSYSYHMPYGLYVLTTSSEPGMAVAADRNPWIRSPAAAPKVFSKFIPDIPPVFSGTTEQAKYGNSVAHQEDGQNVLFLDGHVEFKERAYCGIADDNIYTYLPRGLGHPQVGISPVPFVDMPGHKNDSLLVHDPAVHRQTITKQAEAIDSTNLKQTTVVATLDCPMPEHQNAIWCSTFQIAWNKLKDDIIGEPIKVLGAEELAARLNQAKASETDLEEKSFYATSGFVKDGILEQIQKEMAKRFPSEAVPAFDDRYRTLPEPIVAYSFLSMDVGFKYPFYVYKSAFTFEDSNGTRTGVTAFCGQTEPRDSDYQQVREQVEILYYKYGDSPKTTEFAVDLCKHTQPYQVVLACMPRCNTLDEAVTAVEQNISEFKNDPNYDVLHKLRPIDTLIVPDILYKLTHNYKELLGKFLGNPKWRDYFFFEAMQMIDFSLSRTGVILKSEASIGLAAGRYVPIEEPRKLHFDRPFLIYVKKRDGGTSPFFVMWVDNAELMSEFK